MPFRKIINVYFEYHTTQHTAMQVEEKKKIYCMLQQALHTAVGGWDSTVAIATCCGLDTPATQFPWR